MSEDAKAEIYRMERMPEPRLRALAVDLVENKIFTDRHIAEHDRHCTGTVFMPLLFMNEQQMAAFQDVGSIYEYYREAGPRGVNGMPIFFSMRHLCVADTALLFEFAKEYREMKAKFTSNIPAYRPPDQA